MFWVSCVENYNATYPKQMGETAAQTRGQWEILLMQDVDNHVHRFENTPDFYRKDGPVHPVFDNSGFERDAIVLRGWEALQLRDKLPTTMRSMSPSP
jgi:hypothetical protein